MISVNAFFEGMRSAFDLAPKQKTYKANFVKEAKTPKVNFYVINVDKADAWLTVGSYMKKAGNTYELQHFQNK